MKEKLLSALLVLAALLFSGHATARDAERAGHPTAQVGSHDRCDDDFWQRGKRWWDCQDERDRYSIFGKVVDGSGVTIRVTDSKNRSVITGTDRRGRFRISRLRAGTYTVSAVQPGLLFQPVEVSVTIKRSSIKIAPFNIVHPTEGLSDEILSRLDREPDLALSPDQIILPNGKSMSAYAAERGYELGSANTDMLPAPDQRTRSVASPPIQAAALPPVTGPQQKKNDVVLTMLDSATDFACGREATPCTKWDRVADPADPVNKPGQRGLTYVFGGKTPSVRTKPVDGCAQWTFGMDCSGMIGLVGRASGMGIASGPASSQGNAASWNIPPEWGLKMAPVTDGSIEAGDILGWGSHIGIAASSTAVISSTGQPGQCLQNITPPRGPRLLSISQLGLGRPTSVLRLVADLTGEWDMYIRCTAQSTDAAVIRFTIQNEGGGNFTANGSGIDYNGAPLSFVLSGAYDPASNVVTATLAFTDGTRSDSFTQKMLADDTGYFPLAKVTDNGGCPAAARLVRVPLSGERVVPLSILPEFRSEGPSPARLGGPPIK